MVPQDNIQLCTCNSDACWKRPLTNRECYFIITRVCVCGTIGINGKLLNIVLQKRIKWVTDSLGQVFSYFIGCNRTFVENRKYVEVSIAVDTPWQGDFWRQEGLTQS